MLTPQVITAVKKTFSRSHYSKNFKNSLAVKDEKGKRGGKIGECNVCKDHLPMYKLQIDHVSPIIPIMVPGKYMAFVLLYNRTFCEKSNLQLICKDCHDKKSKGEMSQRAKWRKKKKYLVCRSVAGSLVKVIPMTNMKDFDEKWEIMDVFKTRKEADAKAKKIRKL